MRTRLIFVQGNISFLSLFPWEKKRRVLGHWGRDKTRRSLICLDYFSKDSIMPEKNPANNAANKMFQARHFLWVRKTEVTILGIFSRREFSPGNSMLLNSRRGQGMETRAKSKILALRLTSRTQKQEVAAARRLDVVTAGCSPSTGDLQRGASRRLHLLLKPLVCSPLPEEQHNVFIRVFIPNPMQAPGAEQSTQGPGKGFGVL